MPRVGLIVEGVYDEAVFPVLIRKIDPRLEFAVRRANGPIHNKIQPLFATLASADLVLAIADAGQHAQTVFDLERFRARFGDRCSTVSSGRIRPVVMVREMEVLLLADTTAIDLVCRERCSISVEPVPHHAGSVEELTEPKSTLQAILRARRVNYTAKVASEIATAADSAAVRRWAPGSWLALLRALDVCS